MENIITTVVMNLNWPPETIGGLFCDTIDYLGLEFWYEKIKEEHERIPKK